MIELELGSEINKRNERNIGVVTKIQEEEKKKKAGAEKGSNIGSWTKTNAGKI